MKIRSNVPSSAGAALAVTVLVAALGCGREAESRAERKRVGAAAAAAASVTAPAEAAPQPDASEAASTARPPEPGGLGRVTAGQLLGLIRSSAKRATLVNAWASWCGPCRRELPMLQALSVNLKPQGVQIILISVDEAKDEPKAVSYLKDNGITLKSYLVDGSIADFKTDINPRWPGMLPASFLFDRSGRLVHFWGGEAFENEITPVVEDFLAGRAIEPETNYGLAPGKVE